MISTLELTKAGSQKEGSHYGATKGSDATEGPPADATCSEKFRDNLFAFLDGRFVFKLMIANIVIIIVDGAFFFVDQYFHIDCNGLCRTARQLPDGKYKQPTKRLKPIPYVPPTLLPESGQRRQPSVRCVVHALSPSRS